MNFSTVPSPLRFSCVLCCPCMNLTSLFVLCPSSPFSSIFFSLLICSTPTLFLCTLPYFSALIVHPIHLSVRSLRALCLTPLFYPHLSITFSSTSHHSAICFLIPSPPLINNTYIGGRRPSLYMASYTSVMVRGPKFGTVSSFQMFSNDKVLSSCSFNDLLTPFQ